MGEASDDACFGRRGVEAEHPSQQRPAAAVVLHRTCIAFLVLLSPRLFGSAVAVHITALRVPAVVRNGSRAGAVLDCEYALGAREQRRLASETGLVVKWFLVGSGPAPVYQWIPGQRPQDFGALRGRVDLAFKVTGSDERGAHRALRIPTPTTDLSGEYKCSVSTFEDEDFMVKRMLVFAPEQSLELGQHKPKENAVNVTCSARGVYPEPKLAIFWSGEGGSQVTNERAVYPLKGVSTRATLRGGAYDVVAYKVVNDGELSTPTIFNCQLRVPEADYIVRKSIVYYPDGFGPLHSSGSGGTLIAGSSGFQIALTLAAGLMIPLALRNLLPGTRSGRTSGEGPIPAPRTSDYRAHSKSMAFESRGP